MSTPDSEHIWSNDTHVVNIQALSVWLGLGHVVSDPGLANGVVHAIAVCMHCSVMTTAYTTTRSKSSSLFANI